MSNDLTALYQFHAVMANSTVPTVDAYDAVSQLLRAAKRGEPIDKLHVEKLVNGQWFAINPPMSNSPAVLPSSRRSNPRPRSLPLSAQRLPRSRAPCVICSTRVRHCSSWMKCPTMV